MKLINPTDDQLNAAFAEKVAGLKVNASGSFEHPTMRYANGDAVEVVGDFTQSADAVLPWLEKDHYDVSISYSQTCNMWTVRLIQRFTGTKEYVGQDEELLARAAVIALLRAHGVEVEFSH